MALSTAMLAIVIVAMLLALNARTRAAGLVILGLLGCGLVFTWMSARHHEPQPSITVESGLWEAEQVHQQAVARMQADILKTQRLAAHMGDAVVQHSPEGWILETYPDGMQIKQNYSTGKREVIREVDPTLQAIRGGGASHSTRVSVRAWILIVPLLALLAAFVALHRKRHGTGAGGAWVVAGGALLLVGMVFTGYRSVEHQSPPPLVHVPNSRHVLDAEGNLADAYQSVVRELQGAVQQQTLQQPSLESIWSQLTAPRIHLDEKPAVEMTDAQRELASAAKVVLSASVPGADPFTQGWLANAAKAIMTASTKPKATPTPGFDAVAATAMSGDGVAIIPAAQSVTEITPRPRPEWVDKPPTLVGNTRRYVVSTDPYSTIEECYAHLRQQMRDVVHARITEKAQEANGGHPVYVPELEQLGLGVDYILSEFCPEDDYIETVEHSFGKMLKAHALLEFSPQQDELLLDRWRSYARRESVHVVGVISTLVVGGLALVYGLLKVDTWTRGYYTKRLFLGVPAVIIGLLSLAALFVP